MEMWKDVVGYEDYFRISRNGELYGKRSGKILKLQLNGEGYLTHATKIGGRAGENKCFKIHKLVADAFVLNDGKPCVNHKDGNKQNNRADNLEWVTYSENTVHAFETGLATSPFRTSSNPAIKLTRQDVDFIKSHYVPRSSEFGATALAVKLGVSRSAVTRVLSGERGGVFK